MSKVNWITRLFIFLTCVLAVILILNYTGKAQEVAKAAGIPIVQSLIVNRNDQPVPVTGSVNVANLPSATTLRDGHVILQNPESVDRPRSYEIPAGVVVTDILAQAVFEDCMFYMYERAPGEGFDGLNNLTALGVFVGRLESVQLHFTTGLRSTSDRLIGFYVMNYPGQLAITWTGYEE